MRPGGFTPPGPPTTRHDYLIATFRDTARRVALVGSAWRASMIRLWRWVAAELTDDPRHPRIGKRKSKSKNKSAALVPTRFGQ
jgi:hypothetical protein